MAFGGLWDAVALWDKPHATTDFCRLLRNRFVLLSPNLLDPEVEWSTLECENSEATGQVVGKARPAHYHKLSLTQTTLFLVIDKHQVHHALLGHP